MKRRMVLYFGSFNPVHRGHIALAEWVVGHNLGDEVVLVVSPHNPLKDEHGLAPELNRFEMCELACAASAYPDRIKASAIEFLLKKPSYTINTIRYLEQNCGSDMSFSILMGADNIDNFDKWYRYEDILAACDILVYPRRDCGNTDMRFAASGKVHFLADAPLFDCSATEIRQMISAGGDIAAKVPPAITRYIAEHGLYK